MRFENDFDVQASIDEVYDALLDVERVAPCLPGAQVLERTSEDAYKVGIKVKLGPMTMQYRGDVEIVERDPAAHRAVLKARAREARGQGTADATVEMRLSDGGGGTHGDMTADVQLSGKAAAMGQGIIQDVSARLVEQFAGNLAAMLEGRQAEPAAAGASAPEGAPAQPGLAEEGEAEGEPSRERPSPEPEALSATDLIGTVFAGRMQDPRSAAALLGLVALLAFLLGRRSARR